nr:PREDICTED: glucagon-like peptide 1 receptor [Latimeria chalumnae]|eukprot:XP_014339998.1 PREDICTED: glucagon-like peptide 1 receptor [Latimeria chalumnae]
MSTKWVSGVSVAELTVLKWSEYENECMRKMETEPPPSAALFCNRTFDNYACWPDAVGDVMVKVPCPPYLPWIDKVSTGHVYRKCTLNGTWLLLENSSLPWRDFSECQEDSATGQERETQWMYLEILRIIYTVGYSLSIVLLSVAICILLSFRRLHCLRNSIHLNLFVTFLLRAVTVLVKDGLLRQSYSAPYVSPPDWQTFPNTKALFSCRTAQVLMQYCIGVNYFWLLCEGIYLQALLSASNLSKNNCLRYYILFGWGTPVLFVVPWVTVKYMLENEE